MSKGSGAERKGVLLSIDAGFPDRVFRTGLIFSTIVVICSLFSMPLPVTVGLALGMAISLSLFKLLCWTIGRLFVKEKRKSAGFLFAVSLVKYPLIVAVLYYSLRYLEINVFALAAGLSIAYVVMVLKVVGMALVNYMNARDRRRKGNPGPSPQATLEERDALPANSVGFSKGQ
ncbi:MAG: ATP synthase subunit I [Candidatus Hydrogenedentota bacterium]|nr:MAG: ATP synthase subunit I [Candidatus Hydrogenedentota bacterium]